MSFFLRVITFVMLFPICGFALEVTTTVPPLHWLLSEITKGVLAPNLIPINNSPHDYQLTPKAARLLQKSDVVFYISKEFEAFAKRSISEKWVELLPMMPTVITKKDNQKDVHIWLDPGNAKKIVEVMVNTLSNQDKEHAKVYQDNANLLIERINICEKVIKHSFVGLQRKKYVVMHDAYEYFIRYFDLPSAKTLTYYDQHTLGIKGMQHLQLAVDSGLACVILDPNHAVNVPSKVLKSTKTLTIGPLGNVDSDYTDLLLVVANGFLECLK